MPTIVASHSGIFASDMDLEREIRLQTGLPFLFFSEGRVRETHRTSDGSETTWPIWIAGRDGRRIRGTLKARLHALEDGFGISWQVVVDLEPGQLPPRTR